MDHVARGLEGVPVAETRLSHVDGERGVLVIGGFPVETLAPQARYEEILSVLWHGSLPDAAALAALEGELSAQRELPVATLALLRAAAATATPAMDALRMGVATLSLDDPAPGDPSRAAQLRRATGLVARFPTLVAAYDRLRRGLEPVAPDARLGHVANYQYMLTGVPPGEEEARGLETYFNTVIDHGMNASTFTARVIISTESDMVSAVAGAVGALKGPLHGGAPGPALDMVFDIQARAAAHGRSIADEAEACVRARLAAGERMMGFGHRVYKVRDPRADVLGAASRQLFAQRGDRSLYDAAMEVEQVVLRILRESKPEQRLATNVEFYTALLLHGVGLEVELFTPTFAVARVGGWTAHVLEQLGKNRLIRPSSVYVGDCNRQWVPMESRRSDAAAAAVRPDADVSSGAEGGIVDAAV